MFHISYEVFPRLDCGKSSLLLEIARKKHKEQCCVRALHEATSEAATTIARANADVERPRMPRSQPHLFCVPLHGFLSKRETARSLCQGKKFASILCTFLISNRIFHFNEEPVHVFIFSSFNVPAAAPCPTGGHKKS